jgi:hypothetical protein
MNKAALVLVAAGTLAVVPAAHAKGMNVLAVCGASACAKEDARLTDWSSQGASFTQPSPYFVLRLGFRSGDGVVDGGKAYWLPDSGWFALADWSQGCWYTDCWKRFGARGEAMLRRVTAGMEPLRPRLASVTIGGTRVANPNAYLPLLGNLRWSILPPEKLHLVRIVMRPAGPIPWLPGPAIFGYDARHQVLVRGDAHFRVPDALAARLFEHVVADRPAPGRGSSSFYAGVGVAALAGLAVLAHSKRNRKGKP